MKAIIISGHNLKVTPVACFFSSCSTLTKPRSTKLDISEDRGITHVTTGSHYYACDSEVAVIMGL